MFISCNKSSSQNCDTILWSETKKLIPADFKGIADTGNRTIAFTLTKFGYKVFPQDGAVVIHTSTYFYPCSSWLNKTNIKNSTSHEQLHFDIAEYHRRLFVKRISEATAAENNFATSTRNIFRAAADERRYMNMEYDIHTRYGQNEQEQHKWNTKIAGLLTGLEKYRDNTTTVILK